MTKRFAVKFTGETPLLLHNDNLYFQDQVLKKWQMDPANQKKSVKGDDRSPAFTWMGYLYHEFGKVVIPSDNLMTVLRDGGKKCPTGKGKGTFKALSQSGILVDQSSWPLTIGGNEIPMAPIEALFTEENFEEHERAVKGMGFELFSKRAKIGTAKHVRVRPRFDKWECEGTVTILADEISPANLRDILTFAGAYAGLGDWRPSSPNAPGPFGKFAVEIAEVK